MNCLKGFPEPGLITSFAFDSERALDDEKSGDLVPTVCLVESLDDTRYCVRTWTEIIVRPIEIGGNSSCETAAILAVIRPS